MLQAKNFEFAEDLKHSHNPPISQKRHANDTKIEVTVQRLLACHPGLDPGSMTSAVLAEILVHGLRIRSAMTAEGLGL